MRKLLLTLLMASSLSFQTTRCLSWPDFANGTMIVGYLMSGTAFGLGLIMHAESQLIKSKLCTNPMANKLLAGGSAFFLVTALGLRYLMPAAAFTR